MSLLSTIVELAGLALVAYGFYVAWPPAGFIAAGAAVTALGLALGGSRR